MVACTAGVIEALHIEATSFPGPFFTLPPEERGPGNKIEKEVDKILLCIQLVCLKFKLTNQDSAGGKNFADVVSLKKCACGDDTL